MAKIHESSGAETTRDGLSRRGLAMESRALVQVEDLLEIRSISGLAYSPDATHLAFVVKKPDIETNGYRTRLWVWERESGTSRELDADIKAPLFIWEDSDTIVFSGVPSGSYKSLVEKGETWTVFYALNIHTLERRELFGIPLAVKKIVKMEGGAYVLHAGRDGKAAEAGARAGGIESPDAGVSGLRAGKDFEVIDRLPIWSDGVGFVRGQINSLFMFLGSGDPFPITESWTNVEQFRVKGSRVIYAGKRADNAFGSSGIFGYEAETRETVTVVPENSYAIFHVDFLDDSVVFIGTDRKTGLKTDNPKFYRCADDGALLWADSDFSVRDNVGYDCKYGDPTGFKVAGGALYFITTRERSSFLAKIDRRGTIETLTADIGAVQDFDVVDGEAAFCGVRGMGLQELYLLKNGKEKRLTAINDSYAAGKKISPAEPMVFENNGFTVHYLVCKPADFDPAKTYPAVLYIHGGAKILYGPVFFHEMQVLASRGFFVVYGNPRGSDGQGSEFARLKGEYGRFDFEDMMKAMDTALARYPQIDPERLGVAGGSYGGIMTNWTIGHTRRFKCAVSGRSLCNMISAFGTADNGYDFVREQMDADPWKNVEKLWEQSPLKYAENVRTPLLLVHSDQDNRCHYSESVQFFTALKYFGVEARMLLIRGESHSLSRTGRPKQRILRLDEIVRWLEKYLKNPTSPEPAAR